MTWKVIRDSPSGCEATSRHSTLPCYLCTWLSLCGLISTLLPHQVNATQTVLQEQDKFSKPELKPPCPTVSSCDLTPAPGSARRPLASQHAWLGSGHWPVCRPQVEFPTPSQALVNGLHCLSGIKRAWFKTHRKRSYANSYPQLRSFKSGSCSHTLLGVCSLLSDQANEVRRPGKR